jgi:hypothetical protein
MPPTARSAVLNFIPPPKEMLDARIVPNAPARFLVDKPQDGDSI